MKDDELQFLKESNAIEGVYDDLSLKDAIEAWEYLKKQDILTTAVVLHTHKLLMKHQSLQPNEIGAFRKIGVRVGDNIVMDYKEVPNKIWAWCLVITTEPQVDDKASHILYEHIHPFVDGNGRTGRMFMNWTRIKRLKLPILIIKEKDKYEYYKWFS